MKIASNIFPKPLPALRLILTGATVGPLVDSLHNQCLLEYQKAMVDIPAPFVSSSELLLHMNDEPSYLLRTSWYIPPLLGVGKFLSLTDIYHIIRHVVSSADINQSTELVKLYILLLAYIVLGAILPRIVSLLMAKTNETSTIGKEEQISSSSALRTKAILAVSTTALIIKLSEYLETSSLFSSSEMNLIVMSAAALTQWGLLDGTLVSLITAVIVAIGGPLSELPFVAAGFWHYTPQASDYFPLKDLDWEILKLLGDDYQDLALSSITGPCYFAVTMDAIALSRWFDVDEDNNSVN